jgi:hypothetical protein
MPNPGDGIGDRERSEKVVVGESLADFPVAFHPKKDPIPSPPGDLGLLD